MRLLLAPDSFKGTLTAAEAAECMAAGLRPAMPQPEIVCLPLADGGEGTLDVVLGGCGGQLQRCAARGLGGEWGHAGWGRVVLDGRDTALIEVAQVVGWAGGSRVPPWQRTTLGVGDLIAAALEAGVEQICLALGGTATTDGGLGMLAALGARFFAVDGSLLPPFVTLDQPVAQLDLSGPLEKLHRMPLLMLTDVSNPLLGPEGAAWVFGPQKGLSEPECRRADAWLQALAQAGGHLAEAQRAGAGAAGGLGFAGLLLGGTIQPGAQTILRWLDFEQRLNTFDWVVTGEGRTDSTSRHGKLPFVVAATARRANKPVALVSGQVEAGLNLADTFSTVIACQSGPAMPDRLTACLRLRDAASRLHL